MMPVPEVTAQAEELCEKDCVRRDISNTSFDLTRDPGSSVGKLIVPHY